MRESECMGESCMQVQAPPSPSVWEREGREGGAWLLAPPLGEDPRVRVEGVKVLPSPNTWGGWGGWGGGRGMVEGGA